MSDIKDPLPEGEAVDPLTLTQLILNHDAKNVGYNWVHQKKGRPDSAEEIFAEPPKEAFVTVGEYETDPPAPKKEGVTEAVSDGGVETNNLNPAVMSSDPKFNPCPAFLEDICRVDGRPCPYSAVDFKQCGKYYLASSGDPELFEISPGRENSQEYQQGIKA